MRTGKRSRRHFTELTIHTDTDHSAQKLITANSENLESKMSAKAGKGGPDVEVYKQLFKEADKNGDGYLTITELRDLFKSGGSNMSDRQIADTFVFFDGPQGDKRITFDEFSAGLDQILSFVKQLENLFKELDTSGDGHLDRNELKVLLQKTGKNYTDSELDAILKEADKNGDNKISFKEFVDACT